MFRVRFRIQGLGVKAYGFRVQIPGFRRLGFRVGDFGVKVTQTSTL